MHQRERHLADHVGIQLHRRVEWDDVAGCPDFLQCFSGPDRDINYGWIPVQRLCWIEHVLELVSPDRSVAVSSPTTDTYRSGIWVRIRTSRGSRLHAGSGHFHLESDVNRLVVPPELHKLRERAGNLERDEALTIATLPKVRFDPPVSAACCHRTLLHNGTDRGVVGRDQTPPFSPTAFAHR